jgi:hypothetical protein
MGGTNRIRGHLKIRLKIKQYGHNKFKREILEFFDTKQDAFNAQERYINEYNTLVPNGYNISPKGGYGVPGSFLNQETKNKIRSKLIGQNTESYKQYNKLHKKGKSYREQMIKLYGEENGIIKALEYKEKISKNSSGENNSMFKKGYKITGEKNGMFGKISHMKGVKRTEESKRKMSESKKGIPRQLNRCIYCNREIADGNFQRWHRNNCKNKI